MSAAYVSPDRQLPQGLIFDLARDAGIAMPAKGAKRPIKCPFHDDKHASAFLSSNNIFFCSCCTPSGGWTAKRFAEELRLDWSRYVHEAFPQASSKASTDAPTFTPADAAATWHHAFARARDDDAVEDDQPVYEYLYKRGLAEASELGVFGIVVAGPHLHPAISNWPRRDYSLIAPLFDQHGDVANVQARAINGTTPKTMLPAGARVSGTVFADRRGQELLRGAGSDGRIVFGEGLTDMLALAIASPVPVLTAPGTSVAVSAVGSWARDRRVLLALDCDTAGETALKPVTAALYANGAALVQRVVWPGGAKDACDVVAARGVVGLAEFLERLLAGRVA